MGSPIGGCSSDGIMVKKSREWTEATKEKRIYAKPSGNIIAQFLVKSFE